MSETNSDSWTGCGLKGCMLWGCVTILILGTIGIGISFFVVKKAVDTVNAYVDDKPAEFTLPAPTPAEVDSATQRGADLQAAIEGGSGGSFSFSEAEINALIAEGLAGQGSTKFKARVTIQNDDVTGEVSIPIEEIFPQAKNKHLNGQATFSVTKATAGDRLEVKIKTLTVKGEAIPESIMKSLRSANLVEEIYTKPENREAREILDAIDSINIEDNRIIFNVSGAPPSPTDQPETDTAAPPQ